MKEKFNRFLDSKITYIVTCIISALNLFLYVSMRSVLGFIGKTIGFPYLTYMLLALNAATLIINYVIVLAKHNRGLMLYCVIMDAIFFIFTQVYFWFLLDYFRVFFVEMIKMAALYLIIAVIVYLVFYFPNSKRKNRLTATLLCVIVIFVSVISFTDLKYLQFNYITDGAVVYAVEDDYQIVWTTNCRGTGWVTIDGKDYYDDAAGSKRSTQSVHKVTVPASILDEAKSYKINSRSVINEEGFSGLLGRTVSKEFTFRPVDESDGIQYYAIADTHDGNKTATKTASYYGDALDFLIIAGDAVNLVDSEIGADRILRLGYGITKGTRPVIFARGNHEVKGKYGEELYKYVGSKNEQFYYTFRLGSVWGVVLDMGEDHDDDWIEFFDTADFRKYRDEQVAFLDEIIENKDSEYNAEGVKYRIAVSHINTAYIEQKDTYLYDTYVALNTRLNTINVDVMFSGHIHQFFLMEGGFSAGETITMREGYTKTKSYDYTATGANFPLVSIGRRSDVQSLAVAEKKLGGKYTGTAVECLLDRTYLSFTDRKHNKVATTAPFKDVDYADRITVK